MIATNRFVFIHLHRTGGQFIRKLLLKHYADAKEIGYHFPIHMLPYCYGHLPVIGFVRNPWDWYVSWYAFNQVRPRSPIFTVASDNGTLGFAPTVHNMLHLGSSEAYYRQLKSRMVDALPRSIIGNRGIGITRDELAAYDCNNKGYYSWLIRRMYGDAPASSERVLGRFEHLRDDLHMMLAQLNGELPPQLSQDIRNSATVNAASHEPFHTCYDDALQQAVAMQEQWVCTRFRYSFSDQQV